MTHPPSGWLTTRAISPLLAQTTSCLEWSTTISAEVLTTTTMWSSRQYRPSEMDPRFSYLYGAYLRYGCDEPFQFRLANSSGRVELIKQLLVDVNAKWVSHKFTINTAPVAHDIAFEPE